MKCACSCKDSSTSTRVLAGFVIILVEEAGVPVPVPGDFLMLALGCMRTRDGCLYGRHSSSWYWVPPSCTCSLLERAAVWCIATDATCT